MTEGAVRSRVKRGTLATERLGNKVYVILSRDEPSPNIGEPTDEPSAHLHQDRLIESYEARIESLERHLRAEREAHGESRRIIAGLVQRIPELEAPPQTPEEAESVAESASEGAAGRTEEAEDSTEERGETSERRPWWRRIFGG